MSDFTLIIGNKAYSSWSLRPWLVLKQTGVPFDEVVIPMNRPETKSAMLQWNPAGKVPVLRHQGRVIWESLAICDYLAELFPQAGLWPADVAARAHARSAASEMHAGFAALRRDLRMDLKQQLPGHPYSEAAAADIARITALWQEARARFGADGPFLYGHFTIADAMFAPVVTRFHTYGVALDPVSAAYVEAVRAWPALQEWTAAGLKEEWVIEPGK